MKRQFEWVPCLINFILKSWNIKAGCYSVFFIEIVPYLIFFVIAVGTLKGFKPVGTAGCKCLGKTLPDVRLLNGNVLIPRVKVVNVLKDKTRGGDILEEPNDKDSFYST